MTPPSGVVPMQAIKALLERSSQRGGSSSSHKVSPHSCGEGSPVSVAPVNSDDFMLLRGSRKHSITSIATAASNTSCEEVLHRLSSTRAHTASAPDRALPQGVEDAISVVSNLLERVSARSKSAETGDKAAECSVFKTLCGAGSPVEATVPQVLRRWAGVTGCGREELVLCSALLDSFVIVTGCPVTEGNCVRVLIGALLLGEKLSNDVPSYNTFYAHAAGVSLGELSRIERAFLTAIDWQLHISPAVYQRHSDFFSTSSALLAKSAANSHQ
ncbi:hypothetical protein DIPPA_00710 [Diplonema papillatum]|nr:hypothetical protein DIPPA_00710 [Diplonema papillatum]